MAEAVLLSVSGGLAGIILGIACASAIPTIVGWLAPISLAAVAGGFLFSANTPRARPHVSIPSKLSL